MRSILRIGVSLFFIGLLIFIMRNNLTELINCLRQIKLFYFLGAIFLFLFIIVILSVRLKKIMEFQGLSLSLSNVIHLSLIGFFFNNFLPTSVAGDFVKAYYTAHYTQKSMESYTSIIIDRLFGIFAFIFIALLSLCLADKKIKTPLVTNSLLSLIVVAFLLLFLFSNALSVKYLQRIFGKTKFSELAKALENFWKAIKIYRNNLRLILISFYTSFISQIFSGLVVATLARGLSIDISLLLLFLTLPLITVVSMLPSLNGLGIRESAYVFFLGNFIGREKALAISILWLGVIISVSLLGGFVYMFREVLLKGVKDNAR
ncbi:MAG: flippase-like domain-containing protein [Candidatus Omnitrophica bacterium]|nr:flippase-like domain-containing protein [Candidatus Omnitrophota bacterium]